MSVNQTALSQSDLSVALTMPEGIIQLHQFVINLRYLVSMEPDADDPTRLTLYFADGHRSKLNPSASQELMEYFTRTVEDSSLC